MRAVNPAISGTGAGEIGRSIESAIRDGSLQGGELLPPVRDLATHLKVSPTTVATAYRSLQHRGLIVSAGRRGTRVASRPLHASHSAAGVPAGVRDMTAGNPDPDLLPDLEAALREVHPGLHLYGQPANRADLLQLAASGFASDGIPAEFLAISSGALDGVERILTAQLLPGDRVVVEDPGYPAVVELLSALGLVPVPVEVDDRGLLPDQLAAAVRGAAACILTPRAQNPFGSALDQGRAGDLGGVLDRAPGILVIEDDHAGLVSGAPAQTLCGASRERWAVVRSVSKALGPDLRLAIVAGDAVTVSRLEARQQIGQGWVSHVLQALVVTLWEDAEVDALLARAAGAYRARREELVGALARRGTAAHAASGLNVWIPVPDEQSAARRLFDAGWAVALGERFRFRAQTAIRISIGSLRAGEADRLAEALAVPDVRRPHTRSA